MSLFFIYTVTLPSVVISTDMQGLYIIIWCVDVMTHFCCTGKGKVLPRTGHEGPVGEQRYSSTLSLTPALDEVGGQLHTPATLPLGKRPGAHCIGGWVGPRAGLDGCGKSRPHRDSIPGPSSP
jgi:hypothetical protein